MAGPCCRSRHRADFRDARRSSCTDSAAAIVTTVKDFGALAFGWCSYHLAIGFVHLFLYFDDPAELAEMDLQSRFGPERVTCVPHDATLRAAWLRLPKGAAALVPHAADEVQTRQQLNARHAMSLAVERGLEWLLHIDGDELFDPGSGRTDGRSPVAAHFDELSTAHVSTFSYANWEAVPEGDHLDPFREVSLFKCSLDSVQPTAEARGAVGFWQARQAGSFFYYYDNGKSAVRVHPEAVPLSVHEWLPGTPDGMQHWHSNLRECWSGRGPLGDVVQWRRSAAHILHYPCCSHETLWLRWQRGNDNCARARGPRQSPPLPSRHAATASGAVRRSPRLTQPLLMGWARPLPACCSLCTASSVQTVCFGFLRSPERARGATTAARARLRGRACRALSWWQRSGQEGSAPLLRGIRGAGRPERGGSPGGCRRV